MAVHGEPVRGRERRHFRGAEKGRASVVDFNSVNPGDSHSQQFAKMEAWIAKQIGEALVTCYPGRQWWVDVDGRNGIVVIACPSVSMTKGYHIHCNKTDTVPLIRRAVNAAGEILERYGQSRARNIDAVALEEAPRGVRDELIVQNVADTKPEPIH